MSTSQDPAAVPVVAPPTTAPHLLHSDAEAIEIAHALAVEFAVEASQRDRERRHPLPELDRFSQSGLWAMNVPKARGGPGLSYATVAKVFSIVSAADASLGQIAQNHVSLIDLIRFDPSEERQRAFYAMALRGLRFGNALSERGGKHVRDLQTRLTRKGDGFVINGTKFYATGAIYAHVVPVGAVDEDGKGVMAFVPRDTPGLTIVDDWSGIGQRTTGSGTVDLVDVPVSPEQILPTHLGYDIPSVHGAVAQIIQAAIDAGIARGAVDAAIEAVRTMARPWVDSGRDRASDDPLTIREIGRLKMRLHAAEAVLEEAGQTIDRGLLDENEATAAAASIAVAEAKVLTTEIALDAASKLFELAGTRSVLAVHNLDRFWRDARTHTLHDPVRWKYHAIGNYVLNAVKPPRHAWL